jgi:protein-S-isoprenylcysteine O-methyltransferase
LRHPSYFGWFWWSIGMAFLLGNPITIAAFACASWQFFADRIPYDQYPKHLNITVLALTNVSFDRFEEEALIKMFGQSYIEYRKRTPTGIPLIK